jgi:hypothetical protein
MTMGATWSVTIGTWVDHDADSWLSTYALFGQSLGINRAPRTFWGSTHALPDVHMLLLLLRWLS